VRVSLTQQVDLGQAAEHFGGRGQLLVEGDQAARGLARGEMEGVGVWPRPRKFHSWLLHQDDDDLAVAAQTSLGSGPIATAAASAATAAAALGALATVGRHVVVARPFAAASTCCQGGTAAPAAATFLVTAFRQVDAPRAAFPAGGERRTLPGLAGLVFAGVGLAPSRTAGTSVRGSNCIACGTSSTIRRRSARLASFSGRKGEIAEARGRGDDSFGRIAAAADDDREARGLGIEGPNELCDYKSPGTSTAAAPVVLAPEAQIVTASAGGAATATADPAHQDPLDARRLDPCRRAGVIETHGRCLRQRDGGRSDNADT